MTDRLDQAPESYLRSIHFAVRRLLWLIGEQDLLIVPEAIDDGFIEYVARMRNMRLTVQNVFAVDQATVGQRNINDDLIAACVERVSGNAFSRVQPYIQDRSQILVTEMLHLEAPPSIDFVRAGGVESLNSKVAFRLFAAIYGWPVPEGRTCRTTGDFAVALQAIMAGHRRGIVKANMAVGGLGNQLVVRSIDIDRRYDGASRALTVDSDQQILALALSVGLRDTHATAGEVVVEAYVEDAIPMFAEFRCHGMGVPELRNHGYIDSGDNSHVLSGLRLPISTADPAKLAFLAACESVVQDVQQMGYRGLISVDGIVDAMGNCYINEVNARVGGSTHLDAVARQLLGDEWSRTHHLCSHFARSHLDLARLHSLLTERGLQWNPETLTGVVVLAVGGARSPYVETMAVSDKVAHLVSLDTAVRRLLAECS